MAVDVIMPKVDMDQETGTVLQWLKQEGDKVKQGETILEIETDKIAIEVEAPASGVLHNILVQEGDTVPIATTIAVILEPGERPSRDLEPVQSSKDSRVARRDNGVPATPVANKLAEASGIDITEITGTGRGGRVTRRDVEAALASTISGGERSKVNATPAARRLARERGVSLASLHGSGPDGRIQAADVPAAAEAPVSGSSYEVIPLRGKRRTIAERMTASYRDTPHITFTARVDMSDFEETRGQMNARAEKENGVRISATAFLVKIVAQALVRHPWLNSVLQEDEIRLYRDIHIGVAVALEDGLIVPVVKDAAAKGVTQIAREMADLVGRAREGKLSPAEVRGATFSISNLGPFGVEQFTAIINPPQAAILAVGAIQTEVVPNDDGEIVVRPMMHITLSADHRVVDGAIAAHFIADLKAFLESPALLLL